MKLVCWNLRGGFGYRLDDHRDAWQWLTKQDADVVLVQEAVLPTHDLSAAWRSVVHSRIPGRSAIARGTAVLTKAASHDEFEPDPRQFPWLATLAGSVAIARPVDPTGMWLISVHSLADAMTSSQLANRDLHGIPRCDARKMWQIEAIAFELRRLLAGSRFIMGGDLNSSRLLDGGRSGRNATLFANLAAAGFLDLRQRHHPAEQQTWFHGNDRPLQLDHVFADRDTEKVATSWQVTPLPVTDGRPLSDHAPIMIEFATHL